MTKPIHRPLTLDYIEGIDELIEQVFTDDEPDIYLAAPHKPTQFLADLVQDQLTRYRWSRHELAEKMDCPLEVIDGILSGKLPPSAFDVGLIKKIAQVINYEPSTIALMLGVKLPLVTDTEAKLRAKQQEAHEYLESISNMLFETLDVRYMLLVEDDEDKLKQYDTIIKALEKIIAQQRRDLKFVETLKAKLEDPNFVGEIPLPTDDTQKASVLHLKSHLDRIIRHLKEA